MRSKHLLVGNWKMNFGPNQGREYARSLAATFRTLTRTDVWVAPPDVTLPAVAAELAGTPIAVGSQNVHWADSGAFTGETSPKFLMELGASFSIVGHSERRTHFAESCELVAKRTTGALTAGLTAIVCCGETEVERAEGRTERVLESQLVPVLADLPPNTAGRVVLAYEPVWAIGTGKVASLNEIADAHAFIEAVWNRYELGSPAVILYGGSVNPSNFEEILELDKVDGALVGGASLKLDQWKALVDIAERCEA